MIREREVRVSIINNPVSLLELLLQQVFSLACSDKYWKIDLCENEGVAPKTHLFGIVAALIGITFLLFDVGSDAFLVYEYRQDFNFYEKFNEKYVVSPSMRYPKPAMFGTGDPKTLFKYPDVYTILGNYTVTAAQFMTYKHENYRKLFEDHIRKFGNHWWVYQVNEAVYNVTMECGTQYLCRGDKSAVPTTSCRDRIRKAFALDPPIHQLQWQTTKIMWTTLSLIAIGGLVQTVIAITIFCKRNSSFNILPSAVKLLTILLSLVLMGPVVVYIYMIIRCARGVSDEEVGRYKAIVATLKMGEIFTEQIPQLITNAASLLLRCNSCYHCYIYSSLGPAKKIAMVTSTLGIAYSICDWIAKQVPPHFISKLQHPWASVFGIFIWTLIFLSSWLVTVINGFNNFIINNPSEFQVEIAGTPIPIILFLFLLLEGIFFALIICSASRNTPSCGRLKLIASLAHLLFVCATIGYVAKFARTLSSRQIVATLALMSIKVISGIVTLFSPNLCARLFNPLVKLLFYLLNRMCCDSIKNKVKEWESWREEDTSASVDEVADQDHADVEMAALIGGNNAFQNSDTQNDTFSMHIDPAGSIMETTENTMTRKKENTRGGRKRGIMNMKVKEERGRESEDLREEEEVEVG